MTMMPVTNVGHRINITSTLMPYTAPWPHSKVAVIMQRMFNPDRYATILAYLGRSFLLSVNESVTIHIDTRK